MAVAKPQEYWDDWYKRHWFQITLHYRYLFAEFTYITIPFEYIPQE